MVLGYARVSTRAQLSGTPLEDQHRSLLAAGCDRIYEDAQPGDTIVVTRLDRRRPLRNGSLQPGQRLGKSGGQGERTEHGHNRRYGDRRLILHIMLSFAEFERYLIISRTQGGWAYRRATDPDYKEGRKPKFTRVQLDHAMELLREHSFTEVAEMTGMSRSVTMEARNRGIRKNILSER